MRKSENYNMNLPDKSDFFSVDHQNENIETIDTELKKLSDSVEKVEFEDFTESTTITRLSTAISNLISSLSLGNLISNIKASILGIVGRVISTEQTAASTDEANSYYCEIQEIKGNVVNKRYNGGEISPDDPAQYFKASDSFCIVSHNGKNLLQLDDKYYDYENITGEKYQINSNASIITIDGSDSRIGVQYNKQFESGNTYTFGFKLISGSYTGGELNVSFLGADEEHIYHVLAIATESNPFVSFEFPSNYDEGYISIESENEITYSDCKFLLYLVAEGEKFEYDCINVLNPLGKINDTVYDSIVKKDIETWELTSVTAEKWFNDYVSNSFSLADDTLTNTIGFNCIDNEIANNCAILCNYFKSLDSIDDTEGIIGMDGLNGFRIYINRSRLSSADLTGLNAWLNEKEYSTPRYKNIKIIYEKANKVVTNYNGELYVKSFGENGKISSSAYAPAIFTVKDVGEIRDNYYAIDNKKIGKEKIVKSINVTEDGFVPDAKTVSDEFSTINASLDDLTGNGVATLNSSYVSAASSEIQNVVKCGNLAIAMLNFSVHTEIPVSGTLATFPYMCANVKRYYIHDAADNLYYANLIDNSFNTEHVIPAGANFRIQIIYPVN